MHDRTRIWGKAIVQAITGAILCLLMLTWLHAELGRLRAFDLAVQAWVHGWENVHVRRAMLALTRIGSIEIFSISLGCVLAGLWWRGRRHAVALLGFAMLGALVLNESMKLHFHRARPDVPWSIGDEHTFSFPSGHSLFSVVMYGTLCWLAVRRGVSWRRRLSVTLPAVLLPLAIGTSRIYLGEHWPSDVLAGWLCGGLWLATVIWIDRDWTRKAEQSS